MNPEFCGWDPDLDTKKIFKHTDLDLALDSYFPFLSKMAKTLALSDKIA